MTIRETYRQAVANNTPTHALPAEWSPAEILLALGTRADASYDERDRLLKAYSMQRSIDEWHARRRVVERVVCCCGECA
jgi:hypothetical protein